MKLLTGCKIPLFVCGCPASGTSLLTNWLNESDRFAIGMGRYETYWRKHLALPDNALAFDRFFSTQPGDPAYDTFGPFLSNLETLREKWDAAPFVGDRLPSLYANFGGVLGRFQDARIIYMLRDPFQVALRFKHRSLNSADSNWSPHKDASFGIQEWNDSAGYLVALFNSDSHLAKTVVHDSCYVLNYDLLVSNTLDRRALSSFLEKGSEFRPVRAGSATSTQSAAEPLTEVERDLAWTLLDTKLLAEVGRIVEAQKVYFLRKASSSSRPGRREWYHSVDRKLVEADYGEFRIPGCNYVFRGRASPVDTTKPYAAVIGSATTFGRFIKRPFASQLETATGMPFINLGVGGARPELYLGNEALLGFLRGASLSIVEVMSARGYPSPLFAPSDEAANFGRFMDAFDLGKHATTDKILEWLLLQEKEKKDIFVDRAYEITFKYLTSVQRATIRDALLARYLSDIRILVREIGGPCIALLISRDQPYQSRATPDPQTSLAWIGHYPHFVDGVALKFLRQIGVPVVEARSQRGFPYLVRTWLTGDPAPVYGWQEDPAMNTYYPSQEMHDDAAFELLKVPLIQTLHRSH